MWEKELFSHAKDKERKEQGGRLKTWGAIVQVGEASVMSQDRSRVFVGETEKHILSMSAEMAYGKQSPSVEWEGET